MAKKDKDKDKYIDRTFVRFGRLKPVKQEGYGKTPKGLFGAFHAPPAPVGFYAMPKRLQEFFLISSIGKTQDIGLPKDDKVTYYNADNLPEGHADLGKPSAWDVRKKRYSAVRREFVAKPEDELWHHLDVPVNEILDMDGAWVKTTVSAWELAVKKERIRLRAQSLAIWGEDTTGRINKQDINSVRKSTGCYSKDHFEVFFDYKIV